MTYTFMLTAKHNYSKRDLIIFFNFHIFSISISWYINDNLKVIYQKKGYSYMKFHLLVITSLLGEEDSVQNIKYIEP